MSRTGDFFVFEMQARDRTKPRRPVTKEGVPLEVAQTHARVQAKAGKYDCTVTTSPRRSGWRVLAWYEAKTGANITRKMMGAPAPSSGAKRTRKRQAAPEPAVENEHLGLGMPRHLGLVPEPTVPELAEDGAVVGEET